ncbi:glycosyl hydrolase family 11 [Clostridium sp. BNL1100]|nr:glycosyl hydrolase family 11 [Clostridium sp. BNL1100]
MKQKVMGLFLAVVMCFTFTAMNVNAATTITSNQTGIQDGYNYELWKDYGNTSMTLGSGGAFSCQWNNIGNALFSKGRKFDATQTYQQLGNITINYSAIFNPGGNSYLCVYGWTVSPLVEFYIVDNWGTYRPTGTFKGTFTVDGGTYDIYQTTRVNQPSIEGTQTFKQYWSVRQTKRTSGTISVSEHFKKWESLGMTMGKLVEIAFTIIGYQSNGNAYITNNTLTTSPTENPISPSLGTETENSVGLYFR